MSKVLGNRVVKARLRRPSATRAKGEVGTGHKVPVDPDLKPPSIPVATFRRLAREVGYKPDDNSVDPHKCRWSGDAMVVLHAATENYVIEVMKDTLILAQHARLQGIRQADMSLAMYIRLRNLVRKYIKDLETSCPLSPAKILSTN